MSVTTQRGAGWFERRLSLDARDPTPFEDTGNFWRATAQAATIVMCVLMLGVLLYLARGLLLPVLCAIAVGLTIGPMVAMLTTGGGPGVKGSNGPKRCPDPGIVPHVGFRPTTPEKCDGTRIEPP